MTLQAGAHICFCCFNNKVYDEKRNSISVTTFQHTGCISVGSHFQDFEALLQVEAACYLFAPAKDAQAGGHRRDPGAVVGWL